MGYAITAEFLHKNIKGKWSYKERKLPSSSFISHSRKPLTNSESVEFCLNAAAEVMCNEVTLLAT